MNIEINYFDGPVDIDNLLKFHGITEDELKELVSNSKTNKFKIDRNIYSFKYIQEEVKKFKTKHIENAIKRLDKGRNHIVTFSFNGDSPVVKEEAMRILDVSRATIDLISRKYTYFEYFGNTVELFKRTRKDVDWNAKKGKVEKKGMTIDEVSALIGCGSATVKNYKNKDKAFKGWYITKGV